MSGEKTVWVCENSMEGIFSAVYDGWKDGNGGREVEIRTQDPENLELFCTYRKADTDREKSGKVMRTILMKLGVRTYEDICYAAAAADPDRGTAIYYVLRRALGGGRRDSRVMDALADPHVCHVSKLRTRVWREFHHYFGFLRFREVAKGVLFGRIAPENDILEMLGPHFANRFPNENWMIYDEKRKKVLTHPRGGTCVLHRDVSLLEAEEAVGLSEEYEDLWRTFCSSITIEERRNEKLQQQLLPLRFRPDMTEFR